MTYALKRAIVKSGSASDWSPRTSAVAVCTVPSWCKEDFRRLISSPSNFLPQKARWAFYFLYTDYNASMTIVTEGNPVLRKTAHELSEKEILSRATKKIISSMQSALSKERFGVAIAAPQIGEPLQIFLVAGSILAKIKKTPHEEPLVCINPLITKQSKKQVVSSEGCLSVPGKYGTKVSRAQKVTLQYKNEHGASCSYNASGFLAQIFQHEVDHLHGILYTDHAQEVIAVNENMEPVEDSSTHVHTLREKRI